MKRYFIILALLTVSIAYGHAAHEEEKLYVQPGSIYVASNGIFLNIDDEFYGVTSVEVDEKGVYIPVPIAGFCGKHGQYPGSSTVCPYCLAEKKRKK